MFGTIYLAENEKRDSKPYIGQTVQYKNRLRSHRLARSSTRFHQSIKKYGFNAFKFTILYDNVPKEDLDSLERYCIWIYDSYSNGYNDTLGGDSNPMDNPLIQKKHAEIMKERGERDDFHWKTLESRERARNQQLELVRQGCHPFQTQEIIEKVRERTIELNKNNNPSKRLDVRKKISRSQKERFQDPEEIKRVSNEMSQKWKDPQFRIKRKTLMALRRRKQDQENGQVFLLNEDLKK